MHRVGRKKNFAVLIACTAVFTVAIGAGVSAASTGAGAGIIASYNGGSIDLSQSWGTATVCTVTSKSTNCFTTMGEYLNWATAQESSPLAGASPALTCSPGLALYQNINYGGNSLIISAPSIWINLSAYGFANAVSSYKVGSCAVTMTDGTYGSGNIYPGATSPGSDVSWIGTAWNDRLQSVYLS